MLHVSGSVAATLLPVIPAPPPGHPAKAGKAAPQQDEDGTPRDIEAIHDELARRIHQLPSTEEKLWRTCLERSCQRARACRAPKIFCSNEMPRKPVSAEREARARAAFYRALQAEMARRDAERESEGGTTSIRR